jgi:cysteine desulfurase
MQTVRKVYLDYAAKAMLPYFRDVYGNPASLHQWGDLAKQALEEARGKVASLIGGTPEEIIFTGSGTEANNFSIKGLALGQQAKGKHIVVSAIEHFSVLHSARTLQKGGFEITEIPVDRHGMVDPDEVKRSLRKDTILVSIMLANGEVGTIQSIKEIAKLVKEAGILLHSDAVAAVGNIPVNVKELGVDALSLAANQFYGPKGAGALWLRRGIRIIPLLDGGIQEGGRRAGTENVPALVGMGQAAEMAQRDMVSRIDHYTPLRDRLIQGVTSGIQHSLLTGHPTQRLPAHASFCIEYIEGESMLMLLDASGIATSSGSACTSRALKASHVLLAMGLPHEIAQGSLLFTIGLENTAEDIDYVLTVLPSVVDRLRQISPLYDKSTSS